MRHYIQHVLGGDTQGFVPVDLRRMQRPPRTHTSIIPLELAACIHNHFKTPKLRMFSRRILPAQDAQPIPPRLMAVLSGQAEKVRVLFPVLTYIFLRNLPLFFTFLYQIHKKNLNAPPIRVSKRFGTESVPRLGVVHRDAKPTCMVSILS